MEQVWVICEDGQKCHKLPCMALVDSSINIKKFKECFWSTIPFIPIMGQISGNVKIVILS
jgi:hypothetical protein